MKLLVKLGAILCLAAGGVGIFTMMTRNSTNEFVAILDRVNPLVPEQELYVKTEKPVSVNGYGTATYNQVAVAVDGKTRQLSFMGLSELKTDRYLKLQTKGAYVEVYDEVSANEVPKQVLRQLN